MSRNFNPYAEERYLRRHTVPMGGDETAVRMDFRIAADALETRQTEEGEYRIKGYGLRWGETADLGWYTESFRKGAFEGVLDDVRFKIGHDWTMLGLARSPLTMQLREDDEGLYFQATLDLTNPDSLRIQSAVERGDVDKVSIGFTMRGGKYEVEYPGEDNDLDRQHVTIIKVGDLYEVSAVDFPAYESSSLEPRAEPEGLPSDRSIVEAVEEATPRFAVEIAERRLAILDIGA